MLSLSCRDFLESVFVIQVACRLEHTRKRRQSNKLNSVTTNPSRHTWSTCTLSPSRVVSLYPIAASHSPYCDKIQRPQERIEKWLLDFQHKELGQLHWTLTKISELITIRNNFGFFLNFPVVTFRKYFIREQIRKVLSYWDDGITHKNTQLANRQFVPLILVRSWHWQSSDLV
jgi:hypothetical protein